MPDQFTHDVFLSHSSKDKPVVRELAARLKKDGIRVWLDEEQIKPGDSIPAKIEEGLEHSRVLVLCMSANAFGSDWAQLEAGTFRFRDPLNKERRFIPLRLDGTPIKGSLAQFLYINWRATDCEQEYEKLLQACRNPASWPQASNSKSLPEGLPTSSANSGFKLHNGLIVEHRRLVVRIWFVTVLVLFLTGGFFLWLSGPKTATAPSVTNSRRTDEFPDSATPTNGAVSREPPLSAAQETASERRRITHSRELASLESFYDHLDYLRDRFAERAAFSREVIGLSIEWQGLVVNVNDHGSTLNLVICSTNKSRGVWTLCNASFVPSQGSRLYGLRKGDVVWVAGSIEKVHPEAVYVFGTNFSLGRP